MAKSVELGIIFFLVFVNLYAWVGLTVCVCGRLQVGHDGMSAGSGWFIKEIEVGMPTKGRSYFFPCKEWLARDKGDGKTTRTFKLTDSDSQTVAYKPSNTPTLALHSSHSFEILYAFRHVVTCTHQCLTELAPVVPVALL